MRAFSTKRRSVNVSSNVGSSPSINTTSSASTTSSSATTTTSTTASTTLKSSQLRRLKQLDHALTKFNSTKKYTTPKTNILRIVLLPYLREDVGGTCITAGISTSSSSSSSVILSASILLKWWSSLLIACQHFNQFASIDKNCYLECISRIISRPEWPILIASSSSPSCQDLIKIHNSLLLQAFELAIDRLSVKQVTLSISAFAGKVFAYAFFRLPDISRGLSFLLNTKVKSYTMVYNLCVLNKYPRTSADGSSSPSSSYLSSISDVASMLPSHLSSAQLHEPRQTRFKAEAAFLNSQYPPQSKINGIKETRGPWCYRWSSLDKIDVFCAFLRHYLTLSAHYLHEKPLLAVDQLHVFALPGFLCILTHIYEITDFQLRQRAVQKQQQQQNLAINARVPGVPTSSSSQSVPPAPVAIVATTNPALPPPAMPSPAIDKMLRLVRDFLSNPHSVSEPLIRRGVVKGFENIIKLLVCQTRLLETVMVDQVFELFINFVKGIKFDSNADDFLDWLFWIDTCLKLLESRSIACEIRALCILYQCWDYIPNYQTDKLHSSQFQPIKYQLSLRLSGDQVWNSLFGHYLPLVRSFYIRLLVWKILGPDSMDLQGSRRLSSFRDSINRAKILQVVSSQLARTYSLTKDTTFRPSDPVLNRRMVIKATEAANNQEKKEAIRTLPYEILDDAAYSCANLSVSDNQSAGGAESISSLSSSNDLYTLGSAGTIPDSSEVSSKQKPNTSSSASKRPSKLASGWMSRLFRHKGHEGTFSRNHSAGSAGSERLPTNSANSTGSSQIRTLFNHTRSSSATVSQSDANSVCSIPRSTSTPLLKELQKEDDGSLEAFESILQTPPRILSSSGSSPSISSKSSSPSLLSSMASLSSPQSSTSSLDFLDQFTSSSKYIRSIQQLQSQKKHQSMKFVPPELNFVVPELTEPAYRFELVTNDLRVSASYQSLRELNNPSGKRFIRQMTPILNSPPRLPSLGSSTDSEIDDDTDIDIDVMEGNLDDIQTSLRLNDDSIDLLKPEPILGSYSGVSTPDSSVYFSAMNTPEVEESDTFNTSSTIIHSANDFANGVYEYNVCVREFEQFVRNRLKDHKVHAKQNPLCSGFQPSNLVSRFAGCSRSSNDSIDNSVNGLLIYQEFADKLREQVPVLTPEEKGGY